MLDRYILCSDVVVPTGFNLELARAVFDADLGYFDTKKDPADGQMKTVAQIPYLESSDDAERLIGILELVVENVLKKLTLNLKPLPLFLSIPEVVTSEVLDRWKSESPLSKYISHLQVVNESGDAFLQYVLKEITDHDAILCIAIDAPISQFDGYSEQKTLHFNQNPWGLILSEGGAGLVLTKRAVVDTLKLIPEAKVMSFVHDSHAEDGRACSRLVRKSSKQVKSFGRIYSDMTNQRFHIEDYGFAIGARSEYFPEPESVRLINDMWGYLGKASALTTLALACNEVSSEVNSTLFLFGDMKSRSIMTIEKGTKI